jgi:hypothetical protein
MHSRSERPVQLDVEYAGDGTDTAHTQQHIGQHAGFLVRGSFAKPGSLSVRTPSTSSALGATFARLVSRCACSALAGGGVTPEHWCTGSVERRAGGERGSSPCRAGRGLHPNAASSAPTAAALQPPPEPADYHPHLCLCPHLCLLCTSKVHTTTDEAARPSR